ncbi:hypothetical protein XA68_10018 [Ophiocordyceps unilateralis]|uniref:Uncharacterized protein n=1 Tax=Ophiocordyceps unilateralis TaxID=268505 RepID=A0A2A9PQM3_OPHUN|nr:hypothetical protein XA68_10018 [Ophiocordyceps unilateralis]
MGVRLIILAVGLTSLHKAVAAPRGQSHACGRGGLPCVASLKLDGPGVGGVGDNVKMHRRSETDKDSFVDGHIGANNEGYAQNTWKLTQSDGQDHGDSSAQPPTSERQQKAPEVGVPGGDFTTPHGEGSVGMDVYTVPPPSNRRVAWMSADGGSEVEGTTGNPYDGTDVDDSLDTPFDDHPWAKEWRDREGLLPIQVWGAVGTLGQMVKKIEKFYKGTIENGSKEDERCLWENEKVLLPLFDMAPTFTVQPFNHFRSRNDSWEYQPDFDHGYTCLSVRQATWKSTCKVNATYSCLHTADKKLTFPVKVELVDQEEREEVMAMPLLACRDLPYWHFPPTYDLICMKRLSTFQLSTPVVRNSRALPPTLGRKAVRCKAPNSHPTEEELGLRWNAPRLESLTWREITSKVEEEETGEKTEQPEKDESEEETS